MKVIKTGSVRVDLLGGTLDIYPINLVLNNVVTLNMATNLMATVEIEPSNNGQIIFHSYDYELTKSFSFHQLQNINNNLKDFGPFEFIGRILHFFSPVEGVKISLSSGAPTGSGLGGSSAMGAVLFSACSEYFNQNYHREKIIEIVQNIESKILNAGPAGYQDYYPSLFGGILALVSDFSGVKVNQVYSKGLEEFLQKNIRLIYSGESRQSGINNWEVYKGFFDKNISMRQGLEKIAEYSYEAFKSIKDENYPKLLKLISMEGNIRESLFPSILTTNMKNFKNDFLKLDPNIGMKICGAGGGGCFILTGAAEVNLSPLLDKYGMRELPFSVHPPKVEG